MLVATLVAAACGTAQEITQEDRLLLDKLKAREQSKADLLSNPSRYISGGEWNGYDKGIINDYIRATSIEFTNQSDFDVDRIEGKITYLRGDGSELATVPKRNGLRECLCHRCTRDLAWTAKGELHGSDRLPIL